MREASGVALALHFGSEVARSGVQPPLRSKVSPPGAHAPPVLYLVVVFDLQEDPLGTSADVSSGARLRRVRHSPLTPRLSET